MTSPSKTPRFFRSPASLRSWFEKNHLKRNELWVGYYKKHTDKQSISWPESVDQALCFGWIDGLRRSIDASSYMIRFTPRKPSSHWSQVNIKRMQELKAIGMVRKAGLDAFALRTEKNTQLPASERDKIRLSKSYLNKFKQRKKAWDFFEGLPPCSRKNCERWVMTAKKEETRMRRLQVLIDHSAEGELIPLLVWNQKK